MDTLSLKATFKIDFFPYKKVFSKMKVFAPIGRNLLHLKKYFTEGYLWIGKQAYQVQSVP